jgi:hypothetical protein
LGSRSRAATAAIKADGGTSGKSATGAINATDATGAKLKPNPPKAKARQLAGLCDSGLAALGNSAQSIQANE